MCVCLCACSSFLENFFSWNKHQLLLWASDCVLTLLKAMVSRRTKQYPDEMLMLTVGHNGSSRAV